MSEMLAQREGWRCSGNMLGSIPRAGMKSPVS